jgi:hypothetical protein
MRAVLVHAGKQGRRVVSAFIGTVQLKPPEANGDKSPTTPARG